MTYLDLESGERSNVMSPHNNNNNNNNNINNNNNNNIIIIIIIIQAGCVKEVHLPHVSVRPHQILW